MEKIYTFEKLIMGIFAGVGVILLAIASGSAILSLRSIDREVSAPGRVVELIAVADSEREYERTYYPVVEFPLSTGRMHTVEIGHGSSPSSFETGDEVTVLYDPRNPDRARIRSFGGSIGMWILPSITGFLGLSFLAAVFFVKWVNHRAA